LFRSARLGQFVYNALSNTLLELDEAHYRVLERFRDHGDEPAVGADPDFFALLRDNKVIVAEGEEKRQLVVRQYQRQSLCFDTSRLNITICPTLQCNFRCPYCFEPNQQDGGIMSPATVARLLAFIRRHEDVRRLRIAWYGGEPTLAFHVVRDITEKIKTLALDFEGADFVTNGYLLDGEKIAQLEELEIKTLQVTLDGPQPVHDRRRVLAGGEPTFRRIWDNVTTLMESSWKGWLLVRINIDKHNLESFFELRDTLRERTGGKNVVVYPGRVDPGLARSRDHACSLDAGEWTDFRLDSRRRGAAESLYPTNHIDTVCVATKHHGIVIGPAGELYKCWVDVGQPGMVIGNVHAEEPITNPELRALYWLAADPYADPTCRECDVLPICSGGCAHKRLRSKHFGEDGLEFCSPYRDRLVACLEAYIDLFRSKEICAAVLRAGRRTQRGPSYRVISSTNAATADPRAT
jgi:uncharacterized protein